MKRNGAGSSRTPCTLLLSVTLVVSGFALMDARVARTQVTDTIGQSYYLNAKPLLDYPLPDLLNAAPELQGLEPAKNQDELPSILDKVGTVTKDLMDAMPNLVSHEEVTEQRLRASGKVAAHRQLEFEYMILVHREGPIISLDEYRTGTAGNQGEASEVEQGFMLTRGFASAWEHFLPSVQAAARFRYLGQQTFNGLRCYVLAFAQKPGSATIIGRFSYSYGLKSVCILYQGIAWIDAANFRILRLRTDLLAPRPDIGLERQTTVLQLGEIRLPQVVSPLWLPQQVTLTADSGQEHFRNLHSYSGYRLFKVESKILPAGPD